MCRLAKTVQWKVLRGLYSGELIEESCHYMGLLSLLYCASTFWHLYCIPSELYPSWRSSPLRKLSNKTTLDPSRTKKCGCPFSRSVQVVGAVCYPRWAINFESRKTRIDMHEWFPVEPLTVVSTIFRVQRCAFLFRLLQASVLTRNSQFASGQLMFAKLYQIAYV